MRAVFGKRGTRSGWFTSALLGLAPAAAVAATEPNSLQNPLEKAADCQKCHAFANKPEIADQPNVSPIAWRGSLMAGAARDPVFWAGVAIAHQDAPDETTDCVRCHAPRAFLAGRGDAIEMDALAPDDLFGVDCDLCHRMIDDGLTPPGNARYTIDDVIGPAGDVPKRGPWIYDGADKPMHGWTYGEFLATSAHCGTCHDVTTGRDRVDDQGQPLGHKFNEQRTYSEWQNSAYAAQGEGFKSCQDCHMPAVENVAGCAEFNSQDIVHATGGRRHDLAGANRRMVEILKALYGDAGTGDIPDSFLDIALANIDATLAGAATLEVTPPASVDLQAGIPAWTVKVTNNTGHKLPTGYSEGRVMWLELTASYQDALVYSSGRWLPGQGLENDPQQRTYEAKAIEHATGTTFRLLRNDRWVYDTRIPPKGLAKDIQTDPVGDRYSLQPDETWPHWDEVAYTFAPATVVDQTPGAEDLLDLRVRLLYVINTPEYLQFLADENRTNTAGADALALFPADPEPLVLAEWSAAVPVVGLVEEAGSSSGGAPTTGEPSTTGPAESTGTTAATSGDTTGAPATGGATGGDADPSGCGCRTDGAPGGLVLALALLARRRRRT